MNRPSKKEKLAQWNRENILDAAKEVIGKKGISGVTIDEIAKQANCAKPTVYAYFKSKDEIYGYIVLENMKLLKQTILDAIAGNVSFQNIFMEICWAHNNLYEKQPSFFESMIGQTGNEEDYATGLAGEIYRIGEDINQIIVDLLKDGLHEGIVKPDLALLPTAFALWGGICGLILMAHRQPSYIQCMDTDKDTFLRTGFQLYMQSILK